jgi:hypothetical protein
LEWLIEGDEGRREGVWDVMVVVDGCEEISGRWMFGGRDFLALAALLVGVFEQQLQSDVFKTLLLLSFRIAKKSTMLL